MSTLSRDDPRSVGVAPRTTSPAREPADWVTALGTPGPEQDEALRLLHGLMVRAAARQVWRMRAALPECSPAAVDDLANQAADEAMAALLGKIHTFEGRSRFSTWAYKFAVLQAAAEVRRVQWRHREVELRDLDLPASADKAPDRAAEAHDLEAAVARAMHAVLTPHQRRVAIALLVDGVPVDVLADRLGSSRGALYKTVHDVRVRLRTELTECGYLDPGPTSGMLDRGGAP